MSAPFPPRQSASRAKLGLRFKWLQDRRCRKHGHLLNPSITVGQLGGAYWPVCDRCGYAVEDRESELKYVWGRAYIEGYDAAMKLQGEPEPDEAARP